MLTPVDIPVPTYNNVKDVISSHSVDTISRFFLYVLLLKFLHIATLMYSMDNEFENKYQLKANLPTLETFDWITLQTEFTQVQVNIRLWEMPLKIHKRESIQGVYCS